MKKIISLTAVALVALIVSGCGTATTPNIAQEGGLAPSVPAPTNSNPVQPVAPGVPAANNPAPAELKVENRAISIQNFAFSETSVTIAKGTTVTWTNNDSTPHQIKAQAFNSASLAQGQSFSYTFNQAGIFGYSCAIHPSMIGSIIVQ